MIVMKFGGSSVANADRIRQVVEIVRRALPRRPVVVVSALRGVTDDLFGLGQAALAGDERILDRLRARHAEALSQLGLPPNLLDETLNELGILAKGISLVKELTPRTQDYVASFGERLSVRIVAAAMAKAGVPARAHDAFDVGLVTDDHFGAAGPLPDAYESIPLRLPLGEGVPVVTGYIGRTRAGDITTLGRNGSDYSGAIFGAALRAEEIQIWTDVDGVMTADPAIVPEAKPLDVMTFEEAGELAYYGGKVLHPYTIVPAVERNIPVRVLNTFHPERPGTVVLARPEGHPRGVKAIAHKRNLTVVNVTTPRMLMGHGFLARIFDAFGRHKIVVNMVSTSEVSVSVTVDDPHGLDAAVEELRGWAHVEVESGRALVCVVGEGLKHTPGIAAEVFAAAREAGVNVLMISQGASKINLAFVVENDAVDPTVRALHRRFFG